MTREDIIRMAWETFDVMSDDRGRETYTCDSYGLERFAALVAAAEQEKMMDRIRNIIVEAEERGATAEREACAKVCEEECADPDDQFKNYEDTHADGWQDGCNSCAWAIRARGTK